MLRVGFWEKFKSGEMRTSREAFLAEMKHPQGPRRLCSWLRCGDAGQGCGVPGVPEAKGFGDARALERVSCGCWCQERWGGGFGGSRCPDGALPVVLTVNTI